MVTQDGIAYLSKYDGCFSEQNMEERQCQNYKPETMALKLLKMLIGISTVLH